MESYKCFIIALFLSVVTYSADCQQHNKKYFRIKAEVLNQELKRHKMNMVVSPRGDKSYFKEISDSMSNRLVLLYDANQKEIAQLQLTVDSFKRIFDSVPKGLVLEYVTHDTVYVPTKEVWDVGFENPHYRVRLNPNHELVSGLVGNYYNIDLKHVIILADGVFEQFFLFRPYFYTIPSHERKDFNKTLAIVASDAERIIANNKGKNKELFFWGSADATGTDWSRPLEPGYNNKMYRDMLVLPTKEFNEGFFYDNEPIKFHVGDFYKNRDLPNLRASFVKDWIERNNKWKIRSRILDGNVRPVKSPEDRYARLILYVEFTN